jgi:hypothetical protein
MSRIEYRENSNACPIVKMYTRKNFAPMLRLFQKIEMEVHHLDRNQFGPFRYVVPNSLVRFGENRWGWYLIAKCQK